MGACSSDNIFPAAGRTEREFMRDQLAAIKAGDCEFANYVLSEIEDYKISGCMPEIDVDRYAPTIAERNAVIKQLSNQGWGVRFKYVNFADVGEYRAYLRKERAYKARKIKEHHRYAHTKTKNKNKNKNNDKYYEWLQSHIARLDELINSADIDNIEYKEYDDPVSSIQITSPRAAPTGAPSSRRASAHTADAHITSARRTSNIQCTITSPVPSVPTTPRRGSRANSRAPSAATSPRGTATTVPNTPRKSITSNTVPNSPRANPVPNKLIKNLQQNVSVLRDAVEQNTAKAHNATNKSVMHLYSLKFNMNGSNEGGILEDEDEDDEDIDADGVVPGIGHMNTTHVDEGMNTADIADENILDDDEDTTVPHPGVPRINISIINSEPSVSRRGKSSKSKSRKGVSGHHSKYYKKYFWLLYKISALDDLDKFL